MGKQMENVEGMAGKHVRRVFRVNDYCGPNNYTIVFEDGTHLSIHVYDGAPRDNREAFMTHHLMRGDKVIDDGR